MALMVQVVGLGGGKQDAIDPGTEEAAQDRAAADPEAIENARQRGFEIVQCFRPPLLERTANDEPALPHIRLDRALQFLIGDRLQ